MALQLRYQNSRVPLSERRISLALGKRSRLRLTVKQLNRSFALNQQR